MTNPTNGLFGNLPMAAKVITLVGAPTVISLWLVWMQSNTLPAIKEEVILIRAAQEQANKNNEEAMRAHREIALLLYQICFNAAKDDREAQSRCFYPKSPKKDE